MFFQDTKGNENNPALPNRFSKEGMGNFQVKNIEDHYFSSPFIPSLRRRDIEKLLFYLPFVPSLRRRGLRGGLNDNVLQNTIYIFDNIVV